MSFAFLFLLSFVQFSNPASQRQAADYERETMMRQMEEHKYESIGAQAQQQDAAFEEHQFVSRFNRLIRALVEFSEHYNKDHSVNLKKIKAVKKAWRDLEKTDSWFKLDEHDASDRRSGTAKKTGAQ
jgi:hypothetical protein